MRYDCIIVGGGPAGAVCSFILQNHGLKCLVLEKRIYIDEKICGGFIPNKCREIMIDCGLQLEKLYSCGHILKGSIESWGEKVEQYRYQSEQFGLGVFRKDLDTFLLEQAQQSGVNVLFGQVVREVSLKNGFYEVNGHRGRKLIFAIGATGINELQGVLFDEKELKMKKQSIGISEIIQVEESRLNREFVYFWYNEKMPDYFWAIPLSDKIWNIGYWSQKDRKNVKKNFISGRANYIENNCKGILSIRSAKGALLGNEDFTNCLKFDCLGCGDFAGSDDYNTGEGLAQAIYSAKCLAQEIIQN